MQEVEGGVIRLTDRTSRPADFVAFFTEEHRKVFKALYFVTGNRADAAELMQDAFLKLWERWDTIDRIDDPAAYLFRVALNGSRMRARSTRRAARRVVGPSPTPDPFDEVDAREDVRQMLMGLSPRQRAAVVLLDLYSYGSEEAGRIMGIRPATVRTLAAQGRAALRITGGAHE